MVILKNNRLLLLIILLIFSNTLLVAQDIIRLTDKTLIIATNIVIKPEEITYQNYNDNDSQVYTLSKSEIVSINYKDGSDITFVSDKQKRNLKKYGKNMVHFHMFDFVYSNLKISYERIISDGKIGIEIPLSIGYKDNTTSIPFPEPFFDSEYTNKLVTKFYSGINFNAYPTGQGKVKYFLGPALHIGDGLYHPDADSYGSNVKDAISTGFIKLLLNNGIVFSPVNNFSFSFIASLGIQYMTDPQIKKAETTGGLSINLSLRF